MAYLIKQKFQISDLVEVEGKQKLILLVEPEYYLREMYGSYFIDEGYLVKSFSDLSGNFGILQSIRPDAAVLSPHSERDFDRFITVLGNLREIHPALPIVTVGHALSVPVLSRIMALGTAGHLERRLTRPRDVIVVLKNILHHN